MSGTPGSADRPRNPGTRGRRLPLILSLLIGSLLFPCALGVLFISTPALPLPCVSRFAGDPFNAATSYVTYRLDGDVNRSHTYFIEVGRTLPLAQGGFTSDALVAVRIPLAHARHC